MLATAQDERRFFIRGHRGEIVYLDKTEYMFRFFSDAVSKDGDIVGYVHQFYDEYLVVSPELNSICLVATLENGKAILLHRYL